MPRARRRNAGVDRLLLKTNDLGDRNTVAARRLEHPGASTRRPNLRGRAGSRRKELAEPDRRLAHELAAGVLRQQACSTGSSRRRARGWNSVAVELQDILRLGAYQLTVLERVPPHAAVDTSVALAKATGGIRAAGFVNAVFRRLTRAQAPPSLTHLRRPTLASSIPTRAGWSAVAGASVARKRRACSGGITGARD